MDTLESAVIGWRTKKLTDSNNTPQRNDDIAGVNAVGGHGRSRDAPKEVAETAHGTISTK